MTLSEKIMNLRKKKGWSQEELAERLDISRQSVSKWESGESVPTLEKVIRISEIFEVSTDYLLKDDFKEEKTDKRESSIYMNKIEESSYINNRNISSDIAIDRIIGEEKANENVIKRRKTSFEEVSNYIELAEITAKKFARAVMFCILSPVMLVLLVGFASFYTFNWHISWVIWPCAGVFYAVVEAITKVVRKV